MQHTRKVTGDMAGTWLKSGAVLAYRGAVAEQLRCLDMAPEVGACTQLQVST